MLATTRSCGLASSTAASIVTLPVVNAPTLSFSRSISSALAKMLSLGLSSTSKYWRSFSTTSGNTARATRTLGFMATPSTEPDERDDDEQRDQHGSRPGHVAEEARHADA